LIKRVPHRDDWLFPRLKPADVAEKTLEGIIHRRRRVYIPALTRFSHPLKLYVRFFITT
jgi:hypothetical protein